MSKRIPSQTLALLTAPVLVFALTVATADADTIYVCWDGSGDYPTIQEGIDAADDGEEVVVCDGTYTGSGNKDLDFHGKAITVRSANGDPDLCIIDCEGSGRGFYFHSGEIAVVDGFTITNGYISDHGGGIYCEGVQATITNCTISSNQSDGQWGGGVYCYEGSLTITNCTITGNTVIGEGGGGGGVFCFFAYGGQATITNCTISNNSSYFSGGVECYASGAATITNCTITGNSGIYGGGVCCQGVGTITNCTISGNKASYGGGVSCHTGAATITNCTISDNQASYGGGVSCDAGQATITNCTISGNDGEDGGGVYCESGSATITNCTIADNAANGGGGGGINFGLLAESPVVTNCLITGNTAAGSGGGLCYDGLIIVEPTLTNCTFAHNAAAAYGGAVSCYSMTDLSLSMTNCILWADLAAEGAEIALRSSAELTTSFSDVQGGEAQVYVDGGSELIWGEGNIDADPLFVDPDGPDGDPNTWEDNDFHLSAGSPCIDAGCNWAVPPDTADLDEDDDTSEYTPLDLDGEGRFFDDPATADTGCGCPPIVDMGAYEFGGTGPQPCPGDLDCDRFVGHADLGILLSAWQSAEGGDLNCDGVTDHADLGILLAHWGEVCP